MRRDVWGLTRHVEDYRIDTWRLDSIPQWQRILRESIEKDDLKRKAYAEWMLRDVLDAIPTVIRGERK